ncbi:class I SAM-dependent methyltransferase [Nitrosopumilus sp. K4]|uniref:class I SAM-dependent methyltransferase n=1 Tax=Nitrosopumilus sp. K4 TaxID=2795383 RepID=UPI001BA6CB9C|nr:class I SAM-dependent methyltransferase [Nitrosopumilus sp. K4]QUC64170.1 class I SAM-dependent methyltransferase [Nitrosopumilus sp. K4]
MEELEIKKDFSNIYTREFPTAYLEEMKRLQYRIPDKTKPLYLAIADKLCEDLQRPINILDIGSSYGINSALMKYGLEMYELDDFFLRKNPPTKDDTKEFFSNLPINENLDFYQIDISEPALKFSEDVGLCKKGICVNLDSTELPIKEVPPFDMVIATGCIGYIGHHAFSNLFEMLKKQESNSEPYFAFSVLRIFDMEKIQKNFDYYGYSLVKSDIEPIRQRRFSDDKEKQNTLSLLHERGVDTGLYEDDGYFYADFYVASPKKLESQLINVSKSLKNHAIP